MKWLLSLFSGNRHTLSLRSILSDLPKAAAWGFLTGPFFSLVFQLAINPKGILAWSSHPEILFWSSMVGVCFSVCFWIAMGLGNRALRIWIGGYPPSIFIPTTIVYNVVGASLAAMGAIGLVSLFPGPIHFEIPFYWQMVVIDGALGGVIALVITAFRKLKKQVEATQAELREKEVSERRLAEAAARAQSLALQAQINPHFFFNTLNSISVLVDTDPSSAREMIIRLADMFRYTLNCSMGDAVALDQEMAFVKDYLGIEQARFQNRLQVQWPDGPLPDVKVPGLVMQPLVENAVKHGIARSLAGGVVQIVIATDSGHATIAVRNTSSETVDLSESVVFRPGHALDNVRARLRLYTGHAEPLALHQRAGWTESVFTI